MIPSHFKRSWCSVCGEEILGVKYNYSNAKFNISNAKICYECNYWLNDALKSLSYPQVIDGSLWNFPPTQIKKNKVRRIMTREGEVIISTDYYNYGAIPARFWNIYPNTASFLSIYQLRMIENRAGYVCHRKGCFDRVNCYFFLNNPDKDWNEIPANWQEGGEQCPLFINIKNPKN